MTLVFGAAILSIAAQTVTASVDDSRLAAASDGTGHVWITRDAGASWRRKTATDRADDASNELSDEPNDLEADEVGNPAIRALAFFGQDLLLATANGLMQIDEQGHIHRRSGQVLDTMAWDGVTLWASRADRLLRSDDGRTFHAAGRLPRYPAISLGTAGSRLLVVAEKSLFVRVGENWRDSGQKCIAAAVSPNGTIFCATTTSVERLVDSANFERWESWLPFSCRALAVGANDVWLALDGMVGKSSDVQPVPASKRTFHELHRPLSHGSGTPLNWLPRLALIARGQFENERTIAVVRLDLSWDLDPQTPQSSQVIATWEAFENARLKWAAWRSDTTPEGP